MEISSLIVSKNKHVLLIVFLGLLSILKIASAANEKSQIYTIHLGSIKHDHPNLVTESHHNILGPLLGSKEASQRSMIYSYKHGFSGFAAKLTPSQARTLSEHPEVVHISKGKKLKLKTTRVSDYLGLTPSSPKGLLQDTDMGSDAIVGVLDSGIWPESDSFNDIGLGPIPTRWKGKCDTGDDFSAENCNKKLIGARFYPMGLLDKYNGTFNATDQEESLSPRDFIGHGTHVASTAAGSFVQNAEFFGVAAGTARGSAPRARVASYKVCWNNEECFSPDIVKAMDDAIHDGVDVLSLSLGAGPPLDFEVDRNDFAIAAFHAVMKGIPVVCAAGNEGPIAQSVSNVAPWVISVAATTMDRSFFTPITLGNNVTVLGQDSVYIGEDVGFVDIIAFDDLNEDDMETGIAEGKIMLFFQTGKSGEDYSDFAKKSGGVGAIIAGEGTDKVQPCSADIACAFVDFEAGMDILFYIKTHKSPKAKMGKTKTFTGRPTATKVAKFSSRGPNSISPAILKPDIAAPGSGILAAVSSDEIKFDVMSGTSMATPVIAGIVGLMRQKRPDWSPAAIRSALVTTAKKTDLYGEPITAAGSPPKSADPFDYGGGLVNPGKVTDPGLVYDMGYEDYVQYLCSAGYNNRSISGLLGKVYKCSSPTPSMLDVNLPSITIPYLSKEVTITRTVTNVGPVNSVYKAVIEPPSGINVKVNPETLVFNSKTKKATFKVTISSNHKVNTEYLFGGLTWTDQGARHKVAIPLSVRTRVLNFKF